MEEIELNRAEAGAVAVGPEEGRTVELRIVPWNVTAQTADGPEAFARGAFKGTDPGRVTIEAQRHGGPLVGRGVAIEERDDAAYLTARIAPTPAGDELLTLAREGVLQDASVVFVPRTSKRRSDGVVERQSVELRRVAILERGAYPGAGVVAVRAAEDEVQDMGETVDIQPLVERIAAVEERAERLAAMQTVPAAAPASPLAGVGSFGELLKRAATGEPELARALADQIFDDLNSYGGMNPPNWLAPVSEIVSSGRPTINAFGRRPAPTTGLQVSWPRVTGWSDDPMAPQLNEKQEIQSAVLQMDTGSRPLRTFAGGADISYQLIRRSEPAFLNVWGAEMLKAWAQLTNAEMANAVVNFAGTYSQNDYDIDTDTDGSELLERLFQASTDVETVTGQPAEFVIASTGYFRKLAGMTRIVPGYTGNLSASAGTATASTLTVNISGLPIIHERYFSTQEVEGFFVSNRTTMAWFEEGPFTITAEDVAKLGQNIAVWGMGCAAAFRENGIVRIYGD